MVKPTWTSDCGTVHLWQADCMGVCPNWSGDAMITDPPYGISYRSARRTDRELWKPKIANDERPFVWFLPYAARFTLTLCFCRWDVQEAFRQAMGWAGLSVKSQIVWDRMSHGMGDLNGSPSPQHDVIWMADGGGFKFPGSRPASVIRAMRLPGDALRHPNEKPEALMCGLVESYSAKGETIADPFMGSGTTGVAAVRLGRKFLGCEIDPEYFEIARKRIEDELNRYPLFERPAERQMELI